MNVSLKLKVNIFRSISYLQITSCHIKKHIFTFFSIGIWKSCVSNYTKFGGNIKIFMHVKLVGNTLFIKIC